MGFPAQAVSGRRQKTFTVPLTARKGWAYNPPIDGAADAANVNVLLGNRASAIRRRSEARRIPGGLILGWGVEPGSELLKFGVDNENE